MKIRKFSIRPVLSVIAGYCLYGKYFEEVESLLNFLHGKNLETKRSNLLQQFPDLAYCGRDFTKKEIKILEEGSQEGKIRSILIHWFSRETRNYQEWFYVKSSL